jgi:hypothetical protein
MLNENQSDEKTEGEKIGRQRGKSKKVCVTDPDTTMATIARTDSWSPLTSSIPTSNKVGVILDVGHNWTNERRRDDRATD